MLFNGFSRLFGLLIESYRRIEIMRGEEGRDMGRGGEGKERRREEKRGEERREE